jgi:hypothetical protein
MEDDVEILPQEIEDCVQNLYRQAEDIGRQHSLMQTAKGRPPTPDAYKATNNWKAIKIIRYLQAEIKELKIRHK